MKRHAPITRRQLEAMQHIASTLSVLLREAGAEGLVLMVDWGNATTIAAAVSNTADATTVFPRLVSDAPGAVADWARRVESGQAQIVVGDKAS